MCVLYILVPTYRNHPSSEHFERDPDPDTIYFRTSNTYVKHIVPSSFVCSDLWVWVSWLVLIKH